MHKVSQGENCLNSVHVAHECAVDTLAVLARLSSCHCYKMQTLV